MSNKLNLPQKLIPYRDRIEATIKPHVKIHLVPQQTQLWDSKIGGLPYFPQAKADDYPCNSEGKPLQFLAQINFSQIPHLSDFPSQGILQFYLDNDDCYGLDFDHPLEQNHFRVIYFPEIVEHKDHLVTDFSFIPNEDNYLHPVQGEFAFNFTLTQSSMSVSDCHFPSIFGEDEDQSMELMGDYENWLNEHFGYSQTAHQIGGYPDFTQEDPRFDPQYQDYILLLQIDTEYISETHSICWGDAGIGNFFINPDDLRNLDFSRVLYNWDCH